MTGKILAGALVMAAMIAGAAMYYLQIYAYYDPITEEQAGIGLTPVGEEVAVPVPVIWESGIDADSSPLRFRACFRIDLPQEDLAAAYTLYPRPEPLNAPGWFDCFDAAEIGVALEEGRAQAFLSQHEIADGVDRVIAIFADGRAFAWHQLNDKYRD